MAEYYSRIYPPDYMDKDAPHCPECQEKMFYVGQKHCLEQGRLFEHRLFQCCECRRLFEEVKNNG